MFFEIVKIYFKNDIESIVLKKFDKIDDKGIFQKKLFYYHKFYKIPTFFCITSLFHFMNYCL